MSSIDEFRGLVAENRKVGVGKGDSLQVRMHTALRNASENVADD